MAIQAGASLVKVRARLPQGELDRVGGGVVVAPGLVATNAHVAAGGSPILVSQGGVTWRATAIRVDPDLDLCLLTVPGLPLPPAEAGGGNLAAGAPVFALGFPGGHGPVVSQGRLRAIWHYRDGWLLQADVETHPGSSGGGLFDARGRLLGLTTFTAARSPRLSFAISISGLEALEGLPAETPGRPLRTGFTEAEDYLAALAEDPRNAAEWEPAARAWVAAEPGSPDAWFALGLALDQAERREIRGGGAGGTGVQEAVEAYRRALALRPEARVWNNLGVALDAQNRFVEAEHAFDEALKLRPDYALAWLNLGSTLLNALRFDAAATAFRKGLVLRPDEAEGWIRLAQCQRKLQDWRAEIEVLEVALRYRPLSQELWLDYGAAQAHLGRRAEAEDVLRRLVEWDSPLVDRLRRVLRRVSRRQPARP
ncbi:tetratricopeptide repeat-containing serine protease family protein [Geothrix rubra]|uniref:tetratricopeptide repeat-containing S1 family peptidase n=1 Tax=Geothrix rubra TaxID=2927977 RepID=UPI0025578418|nr:serine protease [Geothrix rubra]